MSSESAAKLTPDAQGHNDLYWCESSNKPVVLVNDQCDECYTKGIVPEKSHYRHKFLAHIYNGHSANDMTVLAEVVKGTDDAEAEIEILRKAISQFSQQVHQAYHGAQAPDLSDVNHHECPRGLCRSVQHVLDPKRVRGTP